MINRSSCQVQVGAVVTDSNGIVSLGWNSAGQTGMGEHAEAAAIRRASKRRLEYATIYIAAQRARPISARPCEQCMERLRGYGLRWVVWRDKDLAWKTEMLL